MSVIASPLVPLGSRTPWATPQYTRSVSGLRPSTTTPGGFPGQPSSTTPRNMSTGAQSRRFPLSSTTPLGTPSIYQQTPTPIPSTLKFRRNALSEFLRNHLVNHI
jgi:hypothetical protein